MLIITLSIVVIVVGVILAQYFEDPIEPLSFNFGELCATGGCIAFLFCICMILINHSTSDTFVSAKNLSYTLIDTKLGHMQTEIMAVDSETEDSEIFELRDKCLYWYASALEYNEEVSRLQKQRKNIWIGQLYPKAYEDLQLIDESAYSDVKDFAKIK